MAADQPRRTHCDFSCTDQMCLTLDKAGVPADPKWRTLILYMRSLGEYRTLTDAQKSAIQGLVVEALRNRNFSEESFLRIIERKQEILGEPCNKRLKSALAETVALIEEFGSVLSKRTHDVQMLGQCTVEALESGQDPMLMVAKIKDSFKSVVEAMEADSHQLMELSHTDSLTGIGNRRSFDASLDELVEQWRQQGTPGSLAMFDIDHFKLFNDTHGHRIGDQALVAVGRILRQYEESLAPVLPGPCLPFRYGGEEFAVLFHNMSQDEATVHANAIRNAIRQHSFVIRDPLGVIIERNMRITISGGVATLLPSWQGAYAENLIDAADQALYQAKRAGRDRVHAYERHPGEANNSL